MHCDVKLFEYSGENVSSIKSVKVTAGLNGISMTMTLPMDKHNAVKYALNATKISFEAVNETGVSIKARFSTLINIKKSLEILVGFKILSPEFAQDISTNFPNGHGGTRDLNNGLEDKISSVMAVLSPVFKARELTLQEGVQETQSMSL